MSEKNRRASSNRQSRVNPESEVFVFDPTGWRAASEVEPTETSVWLAADKREMNLGSIGSGKRVADSKVAHTKNSTVGISKDSEEIGVTKTLSLDAESEGEADPFWRRTSGESFRSWLTKFQIRNSKDLWTLSNVADQLLGLTQDRDG